jgi:hypothetical protein
MLQPVSDRPARPRILLARAVLGVMGVLLTVPAIPVALSLGTGGPLDPFGSEVRALDDALSQAGSALARVDGTLTEAGSTVQEAQGTATDTADLVTALGSAMAAMADASDVNVFGIRPFSSLVPRFKAIATQATAVARSLKRAAVSLGTSRSDLAALGEEVTSLAATAQRLEQRARNGIGGTRLAIGRILLAVLLGWMAATAALSAIEAITRLRASSTEGQASGTGPSDRGLRSG